MNRARALVAAVCTVVGMGVSTTVLATPANAEVVEPPRPAFYEAPATLPSANGTVIRSEQMSFLLDPLNATSLVTNAKRVLYKTTNRAGKAIAVSGVVMVPKTPWVGFGSRPVIGFAVGTQGMGDRCAPSRQYSEGFEYEGVAIQALLTRGYAVAVSDYEGLGTKGIHTYMDRVSQGRAVLDVIRAAQRLSGTGLSATSPVGIQGYSQGGGAAAAAAELAATYAPELKIKGVAVGAVPADLARVATTLDGGLYSAFAFFALRGISASYGTDLVPYLNAKGVETMTTVERDCVFDLFGHSFVKSSTLSYNGKPMSELIALPKFSAMIANQRIGNIKPSMPVYIGHSRFDDVIPHGVGKTMASSWCNKGANVVFSTTLIPTHVGGYVPFGVEASLFFERRFAGLRQWSNCWAF